MGVGSTCLPPTPQKSIGLGVWDPHPVAVHMALAPNLVEVRGPDMAVQKLVAQVRKLVAQNFLPMSKPGTWGRYLGGTPHEPPPILDASVVSNFHNFRPGIDLPRKAPVPQKGPVGRNFLDHTGKPDFGGVKPQH